MSERITVDQVIEEARHWPREQVAKLVDNLTLTLQPGAEPEIDAAWQRNSPPVNRTGKRPGSDDSRRDRKRTSS
jgi:hypothetical protein